MIRKTNIKTILERDFCNRHITPFLIEHEFWYCRQGKDAKKKGVPDYILNINGRFLGIEVKKESGELSDNQKLQRDRLLKEHHGCYVVLRPSGWERMKVALLKIRKITNRSKR